MEKGPPAPPISLDYLEGLLASGDSYTFLKETFVYVKQTLSLNETHMRWNAPLKDRKRLLFFIGDVSGA